MAEEGQKKKGPGIKSYGVSLRVTCEVAPTPGETDDETGKAEPPPQVFLRYTFANGDAVITGGLNPGGGDWKSREAPEGSALDPSAGDVVYSYAKDHSFTVTDETLETLNEQPVVCFFLGVKNGAPAEEGEDPRDLNYVQALHADLSAFFVNESKVVAVRGVDQFPPPAIARDDASSDSSDDDESVAETAPTETTGRPAGFRGPAASALRYARITVEMAKEGEAFMSPEALRAHNPLSVKVKAASNLPGVRTDAAPLKKYVEPDPHALLKTYCRPAFVVIRPPLVSPKPLTEDVDGNPVEISRRDRAVAALGRASASDGRAAAQKIPFTHTVAWLTGAIDRETLEELLATRPLAVEMHDRDLAPEESNDEGLEDGDPAKKMALFAAEPELRVETWEKLVLAPRLEFDSAARAVSAAGWLPKDSKSAEAAVSPGKPTLIDSPGQSRPATPGSELNDSRPGTAGSGGAPKRKVPDADAATLQEVDALYPRPRRNLVARNPVGGAASRPRAPPTEEPRRVAAAPLRPTTSPRKRTRHTGTRTRSAGRGLGRATTTRTAARRRGSTGCSRTRRRWRGRSGPTTPRTSRGRRLARASSGSPRTTRGSSTPSRRGRIRPGPARAVRETRGRPRGS